VKISRRIFLGTVGIGLVTPAGAQLLPQTLRTKGNQPAWRHAASLFGDVKYPPGFCHFDYTNPAAVKGGSVRQSAPGTFDNFNVVTDGVKSNLAAGIDLIHDTLLLPSLDEPASKYGLLAESLAYPADFSWVRYRLRPEARWHDGIPITPKDVIFSFHTFKQHSPRVAGYYRHVTKVEVTGEREITFTFDAPGIRELPQILGQLTILPKHWWEANDASGVRRAVGATTLEAPLGSGPYRIKSFEAGRNIVYERVQDYWGKQLNVRCGCNNIDELRFIYFRDRTIAFEASRPATWIGTSNTAPRPGRQAMTLLRRGRDRSCVKNFRSAMWG
jgi:microcin C transport system substrate-binding protein